jgi:hypothetical protein
MDAKYVVTTAVGIAALGGPGLVAQPEAATPPRPLLVRPGVGIGPVKVGETLNVLNKQFPHVAVLGGESFSLRLHGKTIKGNLGADHVTRVRSTASNLVLGGQHLQNHQASETQKLVHSGWKASTCLAGHPLVYRRDTETRLVTVLVWGGAGVPPLALIQPRIPSAWIHCPSSGSAPTNYAGRLYEAGMAIRIVGSGRWGRAIARIEWVIHPHRPDRTAR